MGWFLLKRGWTVAILLMGLAVFMGLRSFQAVCLDATGADMHMTVTMQVAHSGVCHTIGLRTNVEFLLLCLICLLLSVLTMTLRQKTKI